VWFSGSGFSPGFDGFVDDASEMRRVDLEREIADGDISPNIEFYVTVGFVRRRFQVCEFTGMNSSIECGNFPPNPYQQECVSCKFNEICLEAGIRTF